MLYRYLLLFTLCFHWSAAGTWYRDREYFKQGASRVGNALSTVDGNSEPGKLLSLYTLNDGSDFAFMTTTATGMYWGPCDDERKPVVATNDRVSKVDGAPVNFTVTFTATNRHSIGLDLIATSGRFGKIGIFFNVGSCKLVVHERSSTGETLTNVYPMTTSASHDGDFVGYATNNQLLSFVVWPNAGMYWGFVRMYNQAKAVPQCELNCPAGFSCTDPSSNFNFACVDNDECRNANICGANATCTNTAGSYNCSCINGTEWNGSNCAVPTQPPTQPPTRPPTRPPTQPPTKTPTRKPTTSTTGAFSSDEDTQGSASTPALSILMFLLSVVFSLL